MIATALLFICLPCAVCLRAESSALANGPQPKSGAMDFGFLFNAPSLTLELESYQGGVGFKLGSGPWAYRVAVDVMYNSDADSFSLSGNLAVEYHIFPGPISPYVGGYTSAGWAFQKDVTSQVPLSLGAIAGVEVFIFDFLSIYAEYNLACDLTFVQDAQTKDWSRSFLFDSRVGNSARLGFVVYFMREGQEKKGK